MKNIFVSFLSLIVISSQAQDFEGTMKWRMKMEITDPALQNKLGEAQQMLNDPATQAKMKELQAQMNNPQMKALMESNPQLKAQMEKMTSGGMAGSGSSLATNLTIKIKSGNVLTSMEGGMMGNMEFLFLKDKNQSYRLDRAAKTWSLLNESTATSAKPTVKVTKTTEMKTILNYSCFKQIVEVTDNGRTSSQIFWTTTDIKDFDLKALSKQRAGTNGSALYYEQLEGTPLRIEVIMPEGNMTMEVTEILKASLNGNDFIIPTDFKETKGIGGVKY